MKRMGARFLVAALWGGLLCAQSLTIYTEIAPPNQGLDPAGQLMGYSVEVVREIQKRIGNHDPIQVVPWIRGYREIQTKPNVLLFSMARSAERDPLFEWVGPLTESNNVLYVKSDSKSIVHSLEDAKHLRWIGVYREDIRDQYLTHAGFTNLDRSIDEGIMIKKLMAGRIDALAGSPESIEPLLQNEGFSPRDVKPLLTFMRVQTYIAFSKPTPSPIVQAWKKAFDGMKKDGSFETLFRKYYPTLPVPGPAVKPF